MCPRRKPALYTQNHLVRGVGILVEILFEQVQRVALRRAVDLAAVPEIRARGERGGHGGECLLFGGQQVRRAPRQAHEAIADGADGAVGDFERHLCELGFRVCIGLVRE